MATLLDRVLRHWQRRRSRNSHDAPELYRQRDADAFIISFPRSGRTWLRIMLGKYLMDLTGVTDKDPYDVYAITRSLKGLPTVGIIHDNSGYGGKNLKADELEAGKGRYKKRKVILLVRDPRDTVVSYYFHCHRRRNVYAGDVSDFIRDERFGVDKIVTFLNIWAANRAVPEGFLLLRYEDMIRDPLGELTRLLMFLGLPLNASLGEAAVEFASFTNMRRMEEGGGAETRVLRKSRSNDPESFKVRKGQVGGYVEYLSPEDVAYLSEEVEGKLSPFFGYGGAAALRVASKTG
jgi:hypothetical protein